MSIISRNCTYLDKNARPHCSVGCSRVNIILPRVDHFDEAIKEMTPAGFPIVYSMGSPERHKAIEIKDVFFALVASAIPGYVFLSKLFSVELSYYPVFIAVTLVSAVLLFLTYGKMAAKEFNNVMDRKRRFDEKSDENAGRVEAHAYAVFTANLVFVGTAALLAFGIMPRINVNVPTYIMYAAITILSSVFTFGIGCGYF
ncbi:hypothetical protein BLSTO_04441 [Blastocystis sp. subtype 1]